jgi:hypothetical protein
VSKLRGDTNERPAWRAWANEIIAQEVPFFTDVNGEIDRVGLRASTLATMQRAGGDLYRMFVADAKQNMVRALINMTMANGHASYAMADREAKAVRKRAAFYRETVTVPLEGNQWGASKPREACTLAEAREIVKYRHKRQHHERREERWWQAVINRMEREHRAEDEPISTVIRKHAA